MIAEILTPDRESIGIFVLVLVLILAIFKKVLIRMSIVLARNAQFWRLFGAVALLLASGAQIYHRLEGWSYLDAFYFTIITLTTVGYGDFSPQTDLGKIFSMLYILIGLGIIGALIALISQRSQEWLLPDEKE
jgi:voltage-gated potassium channel Kch